MIFSILTNELLVFSLKDLTDRLKFHVLKFHMEFIKSADFNTKSVDFLEIYDSVDSKWEIHEFQNLNPQSLYNR